MIQASELENAGIDYRAGLVRFMDDTALYEAVLSAFLEEKLLERAEAAYQEKNRRVLLEVAHEAKGSCGNAGLDTVCAAAGALVAVLRRESCTQEELEESFARFAAAYRTARDGVRAALGQ